MLRRRPMFNRGGSTPRNLVMTRRSILTRIRIAGKKVPHKPQYRTYPLACDHSSTSTGDHSCRVSGPMQRPSPRAKSTTRIWNGSMAGCPSVSVHNLFQVRINPETSQCNGCLRRLVLTRAGSRRSVYPHPQKRIGWLSFSILPILIHIPAAAQVVPLEIVQAKAAHSGDSVAHPARTKVDGDHFPV